MTHRAAQLICLLGRRLPLAHAALKQLTLPLRHPPPRLRLRLLEPLRGAMAEALLELREVLLARLPPHSE